MRAGGSTGGFASRVGYVPGPSGHDPRVDPSAFADIREAKTIAAVLAYHYPGHPWDVEVTHKGGVVMVGLPGFGNYRYVTHTSTLSTDPGYRAIIRACGEMLERLNMPRRGYDAGHWRDAIRRFPAIRNRRHGPPGG